MFKLWISFSKILKILIKKKSIVLKKQINVQLLKKMTNMPKVPSWAHMCLEEIWEKEHSEKLN